MSPNRRGDQRSWPLRTLPRDLVDRYQRHGWWTDATLGSTIAEGLDRKRGTEFVVHSSMRPWRGSLGELDRAARSFASSLSQWGVGPGDVVVLQLPNWVEAAITFWGAGLLGAVVVPVVHFYGPKELAYIIDSTKPEVVVTPSGSVASSTSRRPRRSWPITMTLAGWSSAAPRANGRSLVALIDSSMPSTRRR